MRFLWMLVPVRLLAVNIESCLSLPSWLVIFLVFLHDKVFVDERERLWEIVFRVGVEVGSVVLDELAQLFLLSFPNVATLTSVWENFDAIGHLYTRLRRSTRTHLTDGFSILPLKIASWSHWPCSNACLKNGIFADSVRIALGLSFFLFFLRILSVVLLYLCGRGELSLWLSSFRHTTFGQCHHRPSSIALHFCGSIVAHRGITHLDLSLSSLFKPMQIFII